MSDKEMVYNILEHLPDYKIGYVLAYLQGLNTEIPNEITQEAIQEAEAFKAHPERYQKYASFADAVADLNAGDERYA